MSRIGRRFVWLLLFLALISVGGCRSGEGTAEYLYRQADISQVRVQIVAPNPSGSVDGAMSFGVYALVSGTLSETCAVLDEVRQTYDPATQTFQLTLTTRRPVNKDCEPRRIPFEERVSLRIEGLPSGAYTVRANGVTTEFALDTSVFPMR